MKIRSSCIHWFDMLNDIYHKAKSMLRPVTQHRKLLERAKYLGTKILSAKEGNDLIADLIGKPSAIGKIGSSEIAAVRHYWKLSDSQGHCENWGWEAGRLYRNAGVYPPEPAILSRFCRIYEEALTHLDVLGVWFNFGENTAWRRFAPNVALTALRGLEPYYHERPWSSRLAGKRVLVVSPFAETIRAQYCRRQEFWRAKPDVLPEFDLLTLRTPQSAYLVPPDYPDWCVALDALREQIASLSFDVALVGAGAWSIPLVAHAKSLGAWAMHLGGATQILFGVKGKAWETLNPQVAAFFNEAWTRPSAAETPQAANEIERGRYW
jgi:hypothetical protein